MSTLFDCPYCHKQLPIPEHDVGEQVICSNCLGVFKAHLRDGERPLARATRVTRRPSRGQDDDHDELPRQSGDYGTHDYWDWRRRRKNRYYNRDDDDDGYYDDDDDDDVIQRNRERRKQRRRDNNRVDAAVTSLVLGIISVLIFCLWPVCAITSLVGFAFGFLGLRSKYHKMAIWGLVLSFVGLVFTAGFAMLTVAGVSMFDRKKSTPPTKVAPAPPMPFFPKVS